MRGRDGSEKLSRIKNQAKPNLILSIVRGVGRSEEGGEEGGEEWRSGFSLIQVKAKACIIAPILRSAPLRSGDGSGDGSSIYEGRRRRDDQTARHK